MIVTRGFDFDVCNPAFLSIVLETDNGCDSFFGLANGRLKKLSQERQAAVERPPHAVGNVVLFLLSSWKIVSMGVMEL
jgi:hypothetical protein